MSILPTVILPVQKNQNMPKFHLITEKTQQKHQVENFVKNTAAFSTRISKISRENNVKRCTLSRFFAFLINAAVL